MPQLWWLIMMQHTNQYWWVMITNCFPTCSLNNKNKNKKTTKSVQNLKAPPPYGRGLIRGCITPQHCLTPQRYCRKIGNICKGGAVRDRGAHRKNIWKSAALWDLVWADFVGSCMYAFVDPYKNWVIPLEIWICFTSLNFGPTTSRQTDRKWCISTHRALKTHKHIIF